MITLDHDERIVLEVRKHWFVLFARSLPLVFLIFLPMIIKMGFNVAGLAGIIILSKNIESLITIITATWVWFIWISFFMVWTDYYLDILMLTNKRIIDVEQKGLFFREISTFRLDRIQDVTVKVIGIIPTFFNFGDIHIQTAGETPQINVRGIPDPHRVREMISRIQDEMIEKSRVVTIDSEK